jgi:hypothetical protein
MTHRKTMLKTHGVDMLATSHRLGALTADELAGM